MNTRKPGEMSASKASSTSTQLGMVTTGPLASGATASATSGPMQIRSAGRARNWNRGSAGSAG